MTLPSNETTTGKSDSHASSRTVVALENICKIIIRMGCKFSCNYSNIIITSQEQLDKQMTFLTSEKTTAILFFPYYSCYFKDRKIELDSKVNLY